MSIIRRVLTYPTRMRVTRQMRSQTITDAKPGQPGYVCMAHRFKAHAASQDISWPGEPSGCVCVPKKP